MIYGYVLMTRSGLPIKYNLFVDKEASKERIAYLSSAIVAIIDFFKELLGIEPESIVGGDHKMNVVVRKDIVLAVISDKNDFMAERIANKFADAINKKIEKSNIDTSVLMEEEILSVLQDEIHALETEIVNFNKSFENIRYLNE